MRNYAAFLFLALFISSRGLALTLDEAVSKSRDLKLSESKEWHRLLHYSHTIFRAYESQADGVSFFVSPTGKKDPQSELEATLQGFYSGTIREWPGTRFPKQSVKCQFPARWRWLSKKLGIKESEIPAADNCTMAKEWKSKIAAKSATLVFSSYFMNNPSSTFGHSLLRLNKADYASGAESAQLLDYGINYAATMTTANPVFYALYGFAGFLPGDFISIPYYYKVREYSDSESRDLWEYDLDLTSEEIEMLVDHLWELGSTYFDYFYLTENCSYHMMTALDAAAPRLNLTSHLPFWVIPADTVKALFQEPGLVRKIHYRPSIRTQFFVRAEKLTTNKMKKVFSDLISTRELSPQLNELNERERAEVLDASLDYIDYKFSRQLLFEKEKQYLDWKQRILVARSKLPITEELKIAPPESETPHNSHSSARMGIAAFKNDNDQNAFEFSNRFALHDLVDPARGYLPNAKIEFMNLRFRYTDVEWERELKLQEAMLISLDSFSSWNKYEMPSSWRMQLGVERIQDNRCNNCLSGVVRFSGGMTWNWLSKPLISQYVLFGGTLNTSSLFVSEKWSLGLGPITGIRMALTQNFILHGEVGWQRLLDSTEQEFPQASAQLRWSPIKDWALNASSTWDKNKREQGLGVYYYW